MMLAAFAGMLAPRAAYAAKPADAPDNAIAITGFNELLTAALSSRTADTTGVYYYLDLSSSGDLPADEQGVINLSDAKVDAIISQIGSLTFGSKDNPFRGTFDGNGYTIKGLNYERQLFVPAPDTGLFAWTDGATIKNINFEDAYVGADYRGGVIVGCAQNTRLEHIKLVNCVSSVTPANNSVSLITNAGLAGGMVAGEMENCTVYDVEVQGGRVINNSTVAVSGLGGEGLYLGAIVGIAHNSTIEYSRVTPIRTTDDAGKTTFTYTQVHNKYDVVAGALAGQAVYAGGIAGSLYGNSSNMYDCFSTADCYTYAATYVSVGAGNVGYVGGLVARADDAVHVVRSHFAGNLSSKLYNAILVIPIVQYNDYLGGLVEWDNDGQTTITDCYFKPSASGEGKDIPAVYNNGSHDKVYSGANFGPQDDATYADRAFWEQRDFDFAGGTERTTSCLGGAPHVNKWIMDYELGIPVHGDSVKATLDFPGAGTVTIGESDVVAPHTPQSTSDPYNFAVQGVVPSDHDLDFSLELTKVSAEHTPAVSSKDNQGYRFRGWHREPNVTVDSIAESHAFFDPIVSDEAKRVSSEQAYTAKNTGPGNYDGFAGGDLFTAYCQGQVLFHDIRGNVIDLQGAADPNTDDDWYNHGVALPAVGEPGGDRASGDVSESAVFLGWTWLPRKQGATDGKLGYPSVTAAQLGDIEQAGAFVKAGDAITQPMDLYPVYADYASNIVTLFEGHEQDANQDDFTQREGVGRTDVVKKDGGRYAIKMTGAAADGALPEGYRFLGWYELFEDGSATRVSQDAEYTLPEHVDLTQRHTYEARFEYRVQYLAKHIKNDAGSGHNAYEVFETRWQGYKSAFEQLNLKDMGSFHNVVFKDWSTAEIHADGDGIAADATIIEPLNAYAHITEGSGGSWDIVLRSDFPGSGTFHSDGKPDTPLMNPYEFWVEPHEGYQFWFWDGERSDNTRKLVAQERWDNHDMERGQAHEYTAHMTASVTFHGVPTAGEAAVRDVTVQRRYKSPYLHDTDYYPRDDFSYGLSGTPIAWGDIENALGANAENFKGAPSPTYEEMERAGYVLLGWIDGTAGSEAEKDGPVWQSIYNVPGDAFCTTNVNHALSYTVPADAVTTRPTDLYPVYAKFDYAATTNIKRAGVPAGAGINIPHDPKAADAAPDAAQTMDVTFTADTSTMVMTDGGAGNQLYQLVSWTIERSDGATRTVTETDQDGRPGVGVPVSNSNAKLLYTIDPGMSYTVVANYEPLAVVYHTSENARETVIRTSGEALGEAPAGAPSFSMGNIDAALGKMGVFVGWTEERPSASGTAWTSWHEGIVLVKQTMSVTHSMELFPVYRPAGVTVNSNIDQLIQDAGGNPADFRKVAHTGNGGLALQASPYADYEFVGWYRDYGADGTGEMVTDRAEYPLEAGVLFQDKVYTAVFRKIHEVRYHGVDGSVLFTANVPEGTGRTFVRKEPGADGTPQEVIIDAEAWMRIAEQLEAQQGVAYRELFNSWQWVKPDGAIVAWDDFCRKPIAGDMDLYPVTRRVESFDAGDVPNTEDLLWALDSAAEVPVKAVFKAPYEQDSLRVNVLQTAYRPAVGGAGGAAGGLTVDATPMQDRKVALYASVNSTDPIATKPTNAEGNAVFTFGKASLTIEKRVDGPVDPDASFTFRVTDVSTGRVQLVTVAVGQDGVGSATVRVPIGRYRVEEDTSWAWRYDTVMGAVDPQKPGDALPPDAGVSLAVDVAGPTTVRCENGLVRRDWTDGAAHSVNVFGAQGGGSAREGGR